jgi:CRP-like cAMP-binding protein
MHYHLLKEHIKKHTYFSEEDFEVFSSSFHLATIRKKKYLLREGEVCNFEGYVTKGCFKISTTDKDGKEHILYFAIKDWWVSDIDSFTNQIPSFLSIQALEDSEVLMINKHDKKLLYQELPNSVEKLFRIISQKNLVVLQRRIIQNHSKTAKGRYLDFITKYPQIVQKITNIQLAAYLGISHEFISKIRNTISKKRN